jgi:hypothetical protein
MGVAPARAVNDTRVAARMAAQNILENEDVSLMGSLLVASGG